MMKRRDEEGVEERKVWLGLEGVKEKRRVRMKDRKEIRKKGGREGKTEGGKQGGGKKKAT